MKFDRIWSYARCGRSRLHREDGEYSTRVRGVAYTDHGIVDVYATHYKRTGETAVLMELFFDGRMWRWSVERGGTLSIPHLSKWASEFAAEAVKQAKK